MLLILRTAYIHGLQFCTGDFVIIMDADFSHHVRCRSPCSPSPPRPNLLSPQPKFLVEFIRFVSFPPPPRTPADPRHSLTQKAASDEPRHRDGDALHLRWRSVRLGSQAQDHQSWSQPSCEIGPVARSERRDWFVQVRLRPCALSFLFGAFALRWKF